MLRDSGKMTAHARLFSRVILSAVCEWMQNGGKKASFSLNLSHQWDKMSFIYKDITTSTEMLQE